MSFLTIVLIAISVAMDAFALAICKGVALKTYQIQYSLIVGGWFGVFQALMPSIGYYLGEQFHEKIIAWDHWIVFVLLLVIGLRMLKEAYDPPCTEDASLRSVAMLGLALATSMDALAIGISFAFLEVNILLASVCIGGITAILAMLGVYLGCRANALYQKKAEIAGGCILILLGIKVLFEHLF